jgi:hypothetical protein
MEYYQAKKSESWPLATARVVASRPEKGCGKSKSYHPHIEYTYSPDGGQLSGTRIRFGRTPCGSESYAKEFVAKYPVGKIVRVGVNPSNAFEAVLLPGEIELAHWGTLLSVAFLFLASLFLVAKNLHGKEAA